ncbi:MAG: SNF2-related protein [Micromonosporaceae bacterium]
MRVELEVEPQDVAAVVGSRSYVKGVRYAQQGMVAGFEWGSPDLLTGLVHGSGGKGYDTHAHFASAGGVLRFESGCCGCPVGADCKHVAALVLAAMHSDDPLGAGPGDAVPAAWERSLASLVDAAHVSHSSGTPLALELSLYEQGRTSARRGASAVRPRLKPRVRLVEPGKTGWIGGSLDWSRLASLQYYGDYIESHRRLLLEFYALHQAHDRGYAYYGSNQRWLDLSEFPSLRLWSSLDEAESIGLKLVHGRKGLGEVARYGSAELGLDVTAGDSGGLALAPVLTVDAEVEPVVVGFIGQEAHGVVYVDRADVASGGDPARWRPRLARLTTAVPESLQRMALDGQPLVVPVEARTKFRDEYYPRLRRVAPVASSDDSFTPPVISRPTLVVRLAHRPGHRLDIEWEWAYQVGDSPLRVPLGAAEDSSYRDPDAERDILASLPTRPQPAHLDGLDTMRFLTEVAPLLADLPGVDVEVTGEPVDYREVTDSLRIGVSTAEAPAETDWFDLGVEITVDGRRVPFEDMFVALARGESHLMLDDGSYFSLDKLELRQLARLIEEARALSDAPRGQLRISRFQAGLWQELAALGMVDHQAGAWHRQVAGLLSVESIEPAPPPGLLDAPLRPYQQEGYAWLAFLWEHRLGGILADDMGLGKTMQSLALFCHAKQTEPEGAKFLVVAPTSVVPNWTAEAARFAPDLRVVAVRDTLRRSGLSIEQVTADADVVVTSYTLFRLDFDSYAEVEWSGLALDEAQFAKNHQSKIYQCARKLPAPFKLAITGTPMENNLMELWSLLSITAPGLFPSPTRFRDYYVRPIERQRDPELLAQLRRRIRPLMRRRTKEQVAADLPPKQEQVLDVELHPKHRATYQRHLQRERQKILGLIDDLDTNRITILRSLTLLRQLSLHAGLIDQSHDGMPSVKIDTLVEHLRDVIGGGHRALVFSQFTGFLDKVRDRLIAEGIEYSHLDGRTRDRASVIGRFKDGTAPVFLISLKAGGFGLNLTEADYCFLLDPWWNPATEAQAVDRTHRIGQSRNVMVYRLIARDTIEEKVMALKARKSELFASVMDGGDGFGAPLTADDIRGLLA